MMYRVTREGCAHGECPLYDEHYDWCNHPDGTGSDVGDCSWSACPLRKSTLTLSAMDERDSVEST